MNERIKELAEQCYEKHELLDTYEFNKEKFAELIVRECMNQCVSDGDEDWDYGVAWARAQIQEHFGVER